MEREEYEWYINLVRDRHSAYELTFEQAEQVYRYEEERNSTYSEKYIFSVWEEFEYELFVFRQILSANQLEKYEADYQQKISLNKEGIAEMDAQRQTQIAHAQDCLNYYRDIFVPEYLSGRSKILFTLMREQVSKVDFLKKEYRNFLGVEKRQIVVQHFRENRLHAPNLLRTALLRHDLNYLFPNYGDFKRHFDEPTRAVDAYLRVNIYISDHLKEFLDKAFEKLKTFNKENLDKHYPDQSGWYVWNSKSTPEEELKDRAMTFLLFDKDAYGWTEPSRF